MNKTLIIFLFGALALPACQGTAQQIRGEIQNADAKQISLLSTIGHTYNLIDSASIGKNGKFTFNTKGFVTGFYQLAVNDSDVVDIIINRSEPLVELSFSGTPLQENILIEKSDENRLLWEYKLTSREAQAKEAALRHQKFTLSNSDSIGRKQIEDKIEANREWKRSRLSELAATLPNSYFTRVTGLSRDLETAERIGPQAVLQIMDFSDPELLRSSIYAKALLSYLRSLPLDSEESFLDGLDNLIEATETDSSCREYSVNYFVDLFGQYGPDLAFQHIASKHARDKDLIGLDTELQTRILKIQKLGLGAQAPDPMLPVFYSDSVSVSSYASKNKATLLFFYSSTCDHCHDQMPGLKVLYEGLKDHGFEILGIALDTDTVEFNYGIKKFGLPWPSFTELKGWGSPAAKAFEVSAAPTMILLDNEMRIMAKPLSARSLKDMLKSLPPFQNPNVQDE